MSSASYISPRVETFQQFQSTSTAPTLPQAACIVGPHAQLVRYAVAGEKPNGLLGSYISNANTAYNWPNLASGALVDLAYTQLFADNAQLIYWSHTSGTGSAVAPVAGQPNQIKIAGSYGFKTNGTYTRLSALYGRDVQLGDMVNLTATVSSVPYNFTSYVIGFAGDAVAAAISSLTADAANAATQLSSTTPTQTAGTTSSLTFAGDLTNYNGLIDGSINETYTFTVLQASTGGDLTTALVSMTSASGKDNVASFAPAAAGTLVTVGNRGLQVKWTGAYDLAVGQVWQLVVHEAFTATTATSGGTYTGTADDIYVITVTRGGLLSDSNPAHVPQITVSTIKGLDYSGPLSLTLANHAYAIGSQGATFTLASGTTGLELGDKFYIPVTAATVGRLGTLILANPLPTGLQAATDMNVNLFVQQNVTIPLDRVGYDPLVNYAAAANTITVNSGIVLYNSLFVDNSGNQIPLTLGNATLYVQYRAWLSDLSLAVNSISDIGSLGTAISGALDPDNPLAWAVSKALANAGGTPVYFTGVSNPDDPTSWTAALDVLIGDQRLYGLVPLTTNTTVLNAFAAHVASQSAPEEGCFRETFVNLTATKTKVKIAQSTSTDGNLVLATIAQNPNAVGTAYTLLTVPYDNAHFLTNGVQSGDLVYYNWTTSFGQTVYTTYTVSSVLSENQLLLVSGPNAAVSTAQKVEVWHPLSKNEQAADLAAQAAAFGSARVMAVWPDTVGSGGVTFPGYHLCAALAGLRAAGPPHQGLTNLPISGFDDLTRTTAYFNSTQLDTMAGGNVWIVTKQPASLGGAIVSRQALTSVGGEEMDGANADSISVVFQNRLNPFIGVANVTPTALALLQVEIGAAITLLQQPYSNALGGQLISGTIVSITPSAVYKDRVVIVLNLTVPTPINIIENHLIIA